MSKVSDAVQDRIKDLYATMATMAAKKALSKISFDEIEDAERFARLTEKWLVRAGARAARWTYERPKP